MFILRIEDTDAERNRDEWRPGSSTALDWLGLDSDEGPVLPEPAAGRPRRGGRGAVRRPATSTRCDCTREAIDERAKGTRRAGLRRPLPRPRARARPTASRCASASPTRARRSCTTSSAATSRSPTTAYEDFVVGQVQRRRALPAGEPRRRPHHGDHPRDPRRGPAADHAQAGDDVGGAQPLPRASRSSTLPAYAHLPMLVNEQRKKLSKRRDPVAVESYRDQGYLPEAFVNYLGAAGLEPARRRRDRRRATTLVEQFAPRGRLALAGLLRREEAHAHERRVRPRARPRRVRRRAARRGSRREAASGARAATGRRGPSEQFDAALFARVAPLVQERVATLGEVPAMVDFLFLDERARRRRRLRQGHRALRPRPRRCSPTALEALADGATGTADALHDADAATSARRHGTALRKAQAPLRVRGHRLARRAAALRVDGDAGPRASAGASAAARAACRRVILGPLKLVPADRWPPSSRSSSSTSPSTFVQIWLTSHEHSTKRRRRDPRLRHGRGQRHALAPELTGAARARRSRSPAPGRAPWVVVTGGKRPGDIYTEAGVSATGSRRAACRRAAIVEGAGADTWQNVASVAAEARRAPGVHDRAVRDRPVPRGPRDGHRLVEGLTPYPDARRALADRRAGRSGGTTCKRDRRGGRRADRRLRHAVVVDHERAVGRWPRGGPSAVG